MRSLNFLVCIFYYENDKETIMDSRLHGNDRGKSFKFLLSRG